jgi:hypothetical protein
MNQNPQPDEATVQQAEHTLRLVAQLPPPEELTDRVHQRLEADQASHVKRGFWSLWMPAQRLQFAAAATLMVAVAGSTWAVYHSHPKQTQTSVRPAPSTPAGDSSSSFGTAAVKRVPPTLNPIQVPPAPKKKISHALAKPSPKKLASRPAGTDPNRNSGSNP